VVPSAPKAIPCKKSLKSALRRFIDPILSASLRYRTRDRGKFLPLRRVEGARRAGKIPISRGLRSRTRKEKKEFFV